MDVAAIGSLLGGLGQAAGGVAGLMSQPQQQQSSQTFQQNWRNDDVAFAREQFDYQKLLNEQGIRMRVADARAAGLHPLAALGMSPMSGTAISIGSNYVPDQNYNRGSDTGSSIANMGQGLGRALAATRTQPEQIADAHTVASQMQDTYIRNQQIQMNDIQLQMAASRLALMQTGAGPGLPSNVGDYQPKPYEVTTTNPSAPYAAAGPAAGENEYRNNSQGGLSSYPSAGMQIDEMSSPGYLGWMWRNRVLPYFGDNSSRPPDSQLPRGAIGWTHHFGSWQPRYPSRDFSHLPARPSDIYRAH